MTAWRSVDFLGRLSSDTERALWYVEDTLGPLAVDTPEAAEQRATLLSCLASGPAACCWPQDQHVHRNTIAYRLRRIEALLPHPLDERQIQIQSTLLLAHHDGAAVLHREQRSTSALYRDTKETLESWARSPMRRHSRWPRVAP